MSNNPSPVDLAPITEAEPPIYSRREPIRFQNKLWLHVTLFAVTFLTTTLAGAEHYAAFISEFGRRPITLNATLLLNGLWYSVTILGILAAHEAGHYLYCRWYNLDASLPYFLPMPLVLTGTLGAVIRIREPFRDKTQLFDIGIAGPLAGLFVLIPALIFGLTQSTIVAAPTDGLVWQLGEPLLFQWASRILVGPVADGQTINMHPMVFACWFGLFATALNLLPFGQLDGGHVVYAVFGDRIARYVSTATVIAVAALVIVSRTWIVPAIMMTIMWRVIGLRHPSPLNPYEPISPGRRAFAILGLIAFVVCFTPAPLQIESLVRTP